MASVQSWEDTYCQHVGCSQNENGTGPHLHKWLHLGLPLRSAESYSCVAVLAAPNILVNQAGRLSCKVEKLAGADTACTRLHITMWCVAQRCLLGFQL